MLNETQMPVGSTATSLNGQSIYQKEYQWTQTEATKYIQIYELLRYLKLFLNLMKANIQAH